MTLRLFCYCLLSALVLTNSAFAAEPKLTLHVPFDDGIDAIVAGGNSQGKFGIGETPQLADGIVGKGLLSGKNNQNVTFDAAGNIAADQWTVTFWMKGLPGAKWNGGKFFSNLLATRWRTG